MADRKVGSVVVVDGERRRRHPHRARPRALRRRRRRRPGPPRSREWMTDGPRHRRARRRACSEAFASLAEHGYRHIPVVDDGRARRHRVDARPDAQSPRSSPSCTRSTIEAPPGPGGRHRGRDRGRRRPRPRGLLPLPPVQRRRAGRQAHASRTSGTCCSRASCRPPTERAAFLEEIRPLRRVPDVRRRVLLPPSPRPVAVDPPRRRCAPRVSLVGYGRGLPAHASTSTHAAAAPQRHAGLRGRARR